MAYIGKAPVNGFHSKQSLTGDGSTTAFALDYTVADPSSLIVSVGGVLQEPGVAYTLSGGGANIVFTGAPSSTDTVYVHFLGTAIVQNLLDINGAEFILDANANTSFTADTDDEIDIKVGGTDRSTIKATGFHNVDSVKFVAGTGDDLQLYHDGTNSYLTNSTGALKLATETSGIALTIGHTTSEVTFGDNVTVTGNLTIGGTTSFGDFNITNVGSIALDTITNDGTDITLDSSGDIILDADGDDILLKAAGTTFGSLTQTGGELVIKSSSSATTALTFAGANATFAGTLGVTGIATFTGVPVLPANTIDSAHYVDGSIDLAHMSVNSIDSDQYVDGSIDLVHLSANSVDSDQYVDGSIDLVHLSANSVDSDQYVDGSIDTAHIADDQVTLAKMAGLARGKIIYGNASGNPTALTVGSSGQALVSDGTDISWGSGGAISTYSNSTNNRVITSVDSSSVNSEANLTFDGSTLAVTGDATVSDDLGLISDGAVLTFGANSEVTLTHVHDDGLLLNTDMQLQFRDSAINIRSDADGDLDINADDEIELNSTLVDINANVEISGTATTTGVHTFTAVPVLPANSIDSAHYVDGSIDNAHIADNAIDSEHYADGSIDNAHIADDAIDSEHYAAGSIDTAHIADSQITAEKLAANCVDSSELVNGSIDTSHIGDNQVTPAKLGGIARGKIVIGDSNGDPAALAAGSADQILTHDGTDISWEDPAGGGKCLQVVSTTKSDTSTHSGRTPTDVTGLTVNITPAASNSKVLVAGYISLDNHNERSYWRLMRGSTAICIGDSSGSRPRVSGGVTANNNVYSVYSYPINFLDSPSTTSQTTYKVQVWSLDNVTTYINRTMQDRNSSDYDQRSTSTITVMEIGA